MPVSLPTVTSTHSHDLPRLSARPPTDGDDGFVAGRNGYSCSRRLGVGPRFSPASSAPSSGFAVPEDLDSIGRRMNTSQTKVVQYLGEAHASENALVRVLQSQIAVTPRGSYRTALEQHLRQTSEHARRVSERRRELGHGGNPATAVVGVVENIVGQALALGKTPFDLLRGSGGEEKVLKNAKDACASEALEIATYTAIERLAKAVGDDETARLAASIRADEEKMLERVLREIPKLTDAVVRADVKGNPSYDVTKTGAADAAREVGNAAGETARATGTRAKRNARQPRKVPGVARAEGELKGAVASENDLAIARYDTLTADEIIGRLAGLSQIDLAKVDAYERKNQDRSTILSRTDALRVNEPWAGYDELTATEVQAVLSEGDDERARQVRDYERGHKNRAGVMQAVERELVNA
jgi:ferritin-like metal-binding protein YciE